MPKLAWKHESATGKLRLTIEATPGPLGARLWVSIEAAPGPLGARLWVAQTPTQDFRTATWKEQAVTFSNGIVVGEVTPPEKGYLAFYGEVDYEIDGVKYHLCTQVRTTE